MSRRKAAVLRSLLLVAAAAFIIFGASRGDVDTVFTKAVKRCLEWIGIG